MGQALQARDLVWALGSCCALAGKPFDPQLPVRSLGPACAVGGARFGSRWLAYAGGAIQCALALLCGPAHGAELRRAEPPRGASAAACLDSVCPGEISPEHGADSAALKINGQWYLGPAAYFTTNEAVFYWPGKQPGFSRDAPDAVKQGHFYEYAVEIFLHRDFDPAMSMERQLREVEKNARVLEKRDMPTGVRVWRTRDAAGIEEIWYEIRTETAPSGEHPIVACQVKTVSVRRCTGGFRLRPGVVADFRFPAAFGPDWLAIYREAVRVLALLKKA
jgi:hypothetical protein